QPRGGIQLRPDPYRTQASEHQAQEQRPVQGPVDDDFLTWLTNGQGERLVSVRRAGYRKPAPVGAPQLPGTPLGFDAQTIRVLDRVQSAVERRVAGDHCTSQVFPGLVSWYAHRREFAGRGAGSGVQPGRERWRGHTESTRVARIKRLLTHPPSLP